MSQRPVQRLPVQAPVARGQYHAGQACPITLVSRRHFIVRSIATSSATVSADATCSSAAVATSVASAEPATPAAPLLDRRPTPNISASSCQPRWTSDASARKTSAIAMYR